MTDYMDYRDKDADPIIKELVSDLIFDGKMTKRATLEFIWEVIGSLQKRVTELEEEKQNAK